MIVLLMNHITPISARHLLDWDKIDIEFLRESSCQRRNVVYNFPSACELRGPVVAVIAAATMQSVFGNTLVHSKDAIEKHGDTVHSRFAGPELDLICNHNFV